MANERENEYTHDTQNPTLATNVTPSKSIFETYLISIQIFELKEHEFGPTSTFTISNSIDFDLAV